MTTKTIHTSFETELDIRQSQVPGEPYIYFVTCHVPLGNRSGFADCDLFVHAQDEKDATQKVASYVSSLLRLLDKPSHPELKDASNAIKKHLHINDESLRRRDRCRFCDAVGELTRTPNPYTMEKIIYLCGECFRRHARPLTNFVPE